MSSNTAASRQWHRKQAQCISAQPTHSQNLGHLAYRLARAQKCQGGDKVAGNGAAIAGIGDSAGRPVFHCPPTILRALQLQRRDGILLALRQPRLPYPGASVQHAIERRRGRCPNPRSRCRPSEMHSLAPHRGQGRADPRIRSRTRRP